MRGSAAAADPERLAEASTQLDATLRAGRRRLRLRSAVRWGAVGLHAGAWAVLLPALLLGTSAPWLAAGVGVGGALAVGVVAALLGAVPAPIDDRATALVLDRLSGSDERLLNALHARGTEGPNRAASLAELERGLPDPAVLALPRPRHLRYAAIPLLGLLLVPLVAPRLPALPMPWTEPPPTPAQAAAEALREEIARQTGSEAPVLPPELRDELARLADPLSQDPLDPEAAREALESMKEQLAAFEASASEQQDLMEALEEAATALEPVSPELAEALREQDLKAAAQAAEQLAEATSAEPPGGQQAAARERAADAMQQAGQAMQQSADPSLQQAGKALEQAGGEMAGGGKVDPQTAQQLAKDLQNARAAGEQLAKDARALQEAQELGARIEEARQQLGEEPGVDRGEGQGPDGEGEGEGEGDGEEQGEGQGEGPGADGQPGGAPSNGAGMGHTWEDQGEFGGGAKKKPDPNGGQQEGERDHQQIDDFQKLYDELRLKGAKSLVAGTGSAVHEAGRTDMIETRLTTAEEVAKAGAVDLPAAYAEAAEEAVTSEEVPAAYREAVKDYFQQNR